jgi:alpha-L-fucosidase
MHQNSEAIYATTPWLDAPGGKPRAEGHAADGTTAGIPVRFTRKGDKLYAILLSRPTGQTITLQNVAAKPGSTMRLLGSPAPLIWHADGKDLQITLPSALPGDYAWALQLVPLTP